jgi:hypothetical protein
MINKKSFDKMFSPFSTRKGTLSLYLLICCCSDQGAKASKLIGAYGTATLAITIHDRFCLKNSGFNKEVKTINM